MTFKQWYARLFEPMPLDWAARSLDASPAEMNYLLRNGKLTVHVFRAQDGRVFKMIESHQVRALRGKPLIAPADLFRAMGKLIAQDVKKAA